MIDHVTESERAYSQLHEEALLKLELIKIALLQLKNQESHNWGHVGDLGSVNEYLCLAGHSAGVPNLLAK